MHVTAIWLTLYLMLFGYYISEGKRKDSTEIEIFNKMQ